MDNFLLILRREGKIELPVNADGKVDIRIEGITITREDIFKHGLLLALINNETPVYIINLPGDRLGNVDEETPAMPSGHIFSRKELAAKNPDIFRNDTDRCIIVHAAIHADGYVRLPKLTSNIGGDGVLAV